MLAVLNLTPDSFHAASRVSSAHHAAAAASEAIEAGAAGVDVGGESTRPGAARVGADDQVDRVIPAIRAIRRAIGPGPLVSVDTTLAGVAAAALDAGADVINDVSAGRDDPEILGVAAGMGAGLILMHRRFPPGEDSYSDAYASPPEYADVVEDVAEFLRSRLGAAVAAGCDPESIALDPGLGFGKTVEQNLELVRRTDEMRRLGRPIVSALSRKSFVGRAQESWREGRGGGAVEPADRLPGTLGLSVLHMLRGASVFRVHDVREVVGALAAAAAAEPRPAGGPAGCGG